MTSVTVTQLAQEINIPLDRLMQQLAEAELSKNSTDQVNQKEKEVLLAYLKSSHGNVAQDMFVLQRKTRSALNISSAGGKSRFVQVEVRKKRTYIKKVEQNTSPTNLEKLITPTIKDDDILTIKNHQINERGVALTTRSDQPEVAFDAADIDKQQKTNRVLKQALQNKLVDAKVSNTEKIRLDAENAELKRKTEEHALLRAK